jgi:hypothetical protein
MLLWCTLERKHQHEQHWENQQHIQAHPQDVSALFPDASELEM